MPKGSCEGIGRGTIERRTAVTVGQGPDLDRDPLCRSQIHECRALIQKRKHDEKGSRPD
jgi:hypothetical protein